MRSVQVIEPPAELIRGFVLEGPNEWNKTHGPSAASGDTQTDGVGTQYTRTAIEYRQQRASSFLPTVLPLRPCLSNLAAFLTGYFMYVTSDEYTGP